MVISLYYGKIMDIDLIRKNNGYEEVGESKAFLFPKDSLIG
jgi:hypothetical protein